MLANKENRMGMQMKGTATITQKHTLFHDEVPLRNTGGNRESSDWLSPLYSILLYLN